MSTIIPHFRSVQQLLANTSFSIDEYQREYKWETKNIEEMLGDLLGKFWSGYQVGHDTTQVSGYEGYFLGSIIVTQRLGKSYLVDGQQRVTSLPLLLIHLYRLASAKKLPVASILAPLIYSDNFGAPKFNLDIAERLPVLDALFHGSPYNSQGKDESAQTMFARYQDIENSDISATLGDALPHFLYWLLYKVGLIEIVTDSDSSAFAIFETMNDRGKPLSPVDMLKAYMLAPIIDPERRSHANDIWKKQVLDLIAWSPSPAPDRDSICIKAWLRAQYAESIRDRKAGSSDRDWELIGNVFHRWVRDNQTRLKLGTASANLHLIEKEFPFFAGAYIKIADAMYHYKPGWEAVYYNSHNEFTWQSTVLLAALDPDDDAETVRRKILATATYLDIWLMRRVVNYTRVGYSAVSYAMYTLCRDIRQKSVDDLIGILTKKLDEDDFSFAGNPSKGRSGIEDLHLNQFSRRYVFHILARVTAFIETGSGKADLFPNYIRRDVKNPFDIEHIWSAKYDQYKSECTSEQEFYKMRDSIGGLLLLPADVNRSLQDKPYPDKISTYSKENLLAASMSDIAYVHAPRFQAFLSAHGLPFKPYSTFGTKDQLERRKLIATLAELIWSPDRLQAI